MSDLVGRTNEYLRNGGLFNPELMDHEKVRDLVIDLAQHIEALEAEVQRLREALKPFIETAEALCEMLDDPQEFPDTGPTWACYQLGDFRCARAAMEPTNE